jgi:hypothetical protein
VESERLPPSPDRFTPWEKSTGTHWIGGSVGPWAGLDVMEKWKLLTLPGLELRTLSSPSRGQSLYRLRYRSFTEETTVALILFGTWIFKTDFMCFTIQNNRKDNTTILVLVLGDQASRYLQLIHNIKGKMHFIRKNYSLVSYWIARWLQMSLCTKPVSTCANRFQ